MITYYVAKLAATHPERYWSHHFGKAKPDACKPCKGTGELHCFSEGGDVFTDDCAKCNGTGIAG